MTWAWGIGLLIGTGYAALRWWIGDFDAEAHEIEDADGYLRVYWRDRQPVVSKSTTWVGAPPRGPRRAIDPDFPFFLESRLAWASTSLHRERRRQARVKARVAKAVKH